MILTEAIIDLLRAHNCVIIPGFGGFIANYRPAVIDQARQQIIPPSKQILFNYHIKENDGLLGNFLAKSQNWSYPDALTYLEERSTEWIARLERGERIEMAELGFLFKKEDQVVFEQNRDFQLLLQAYGLTNVRFVDLKLTATEEQVTEPKEDVVPVLAVVETKEEVKEDTPVIALNASEEIEELEEEVSKDVMVHPETKKRKRGWWKYGVAAAAIPFLFYVYWIPMETDFIQTGNIQMADFNPIHSTPDRVYQSRLKDFSPPVMEKAVHWDELMEGISDHVEVYNYQFDEGLYIPVRLDKTDVVLSEVDHQEGSYSDTADKPYHIIGGCFSVKKNAETLVKDLKKEGYTSSIVDFHNGLYRVSAGAFEKGNTAEQKLDSFRDAGFEGWILKK